ncbi:MAG: flagellar filament capping protein FliD, partial [Spirochaetota bacterium]
SEDGGVTWDDNGGAGYVAAVGATAVGSNTEGVDVAFSAGGTLADGDRFYIDVSTPTITVARDAVFSIDGLTQTRSSNRVTGALAGVTFDLAATTSSSMTFSIAEDDERIRTILEQIDEG